MICAQCKKLISLNYNSSYRILSQQTISLNNLNQKNFSDQRFGGLQNLSSTQFIFKRFLRKSAKSIVSQEKCDEIKSINDLIISSLPKPDRRPVQNIESANQLFSVHDPSVKDQDSDKISLDKKSKKAIDIALSIRQEKAKKKSPFYDLENEELDPTKQAIKALASPNYDKMNPEDLAAYIRKNVIYADKKIVVINKPYGIAIHDGDKMSRNIKNVLPMVSKMIYGVNTEIPLNICNRLDKFTTGVCITSTDKETTSLMLKLFREHKILRKYWAVAIDTPDPLVGIIDIPLDREIISGEQSYARMVTKPDVRFDPTLNKQIKFRSKGQIAITHYNTLDHTSLALIELQPFTTIKHQLRVHLSDGLDCPILGDHKYSHYGKLAPQNLPEGVLRRLGIPHSKTRYIPMHLHLQSILIPNLYPEKKKPHLILSATPPRHMTKTMRKFGLKPGKLTKWKNLAQAMGSTNDTAEPRDPNKKFLYVDPTVKNEPRKDDDLEKDVYAESFNVYRKNQIFVKYKHK